MRFRNFIPHSYKPKTLVFLIFFFVSLFVLGTILAGYGSTDLISNGQEEKNRIRMKLNGELIPFEVNDSQPFSLLLSPTVGANFSLNELEEGISLADAYPELGGAYKITTDAFKIQFVDDKLFVSAVIRDSNGNKIAQIVNNEWKLTNPDTLLYWDRNFNAYALEIINSNSVPTFQVLMTGPNQIQIGGFFYTTPEEGIYIYNVEGKHILDTIIYPDLSYDTSYRELHGADIIFLGNQGVSRLESYVGNSTIFQYPALTQPENLGKLASPLFFSDDPYAEVNSKIQIGYYLFYGGGVLAGISITVLPFVIAALIGNRKKRETPPVIIHKHYNYYLDRKQKKRKKRNEKKKKRN